MTKRKMRAQLMNVFKVLIEGGKINEYSSTNGVSCGVFKSPGSECIHTSRKILDEFLGHGILSVSCDYMVNERHCTEYVMSDRQNKS